LFFFFFFFFFRAKTLFLILLYVYVLCKKHNFPPAARLELITLNLFCRIFSAKIKRRTFVVLLFPFLNLFSCSSFFSLFPDFPFHELTKKYISPSFLPLVNSKQKNQNKKSQKRIKSKPNQSFTPHNPPYSRFSV